MRKKTVYLNEIGIISISNSTKLFPESIQVPDNCINSDNSFNFENLSEYLCRTYPTGYTFKSGNTIIFDKADQCFNL